MSAFVTVMHNLTSPANVGVIVRSHVAMGGGDIIFVGLDHPWRFKKNTQAFSRRLEKLRALTYLPDDDALFAWCREHDYAPVAIEISETATPLANAAFPNRTALVVGHEGKGLSDAFMARCDATVVIPQFGPVACLNAAASASIAMYELMRQRGGERDIRGNKYWVDPAHRIASP